MQAIALQPRRAHCGGAPVLRAPPPRAEHAVPPGAATCQTFFAQAQDATGASVPRFVKDEFDAFLLRGILAHNFLHLRSADCGHDDTE